MFIISVFFFFTFFSAVVVQMLLLSFYFSIAFIQRLAFVLLFVHFFRFSVDIFFRIIFFVLLFLAAIFSLFFVSIRKVASIWHTNLYSTRRNENIVNCTDATTVRMRKRKKCDVETMSMK